MLANAESEMQGWRHLEYEKACWK